MLSMAFLNDEAENIFETPLSGRGAPSEAPVKKIVATVARTIAGQKKHLAGAGFGSTWSRTEELYFHIWVAFFRESAHADQFPRRPIFL
jgi:hypothetical protein